MIVYKPGTPDYDIMLAFLGGLKAGESKPMPRVGPMDPERNRLAAEGKPPPR